MGDRRLDPLDEALRLWSLLTAGERVEFLARVAAPARPRPPADSLPLPVVRLDPELGR